MQLLKLSTLLLSALTSVLAAPKPERITTPLTLTHSTTPWTPLAARLAATLPVVPFRTLLTDESIRKTADIADPSGHLVKDFKLTAGDNAVPLWYPQGVTGTADANAAGTVDGHAALAVSWYHKGKRGVRIGFHTDDNEYVYALLVLPVETAAGEVGFEALQGLHAGGMFWYGQKLYVVDTKIGLRVFDMGKIMRVSEGSGIGRDGDVFTAHGYKYVIPQIEQYAQDADFRFSFTSLDRTTRPHSLLVGEYQSTGSVERIARFELDETRNVLATGVSTEYYNIGQTSVQGCNSINGTYFFARSRALSKSELWKWDGVVGTELESLGNILPPGAEDLLYWRQRDELWSLGEHALMRRIYALRASAL